MIDVLVQIMAGVLAALAAGVKSLQFTPSRVTDYELERRATADDTEAADELHLRREWPLHNALQRLVVAVLTLAIVVVLMVALDFWPGLLWATFWLAMVEIAVAQPIVGRLARKAVAHFRPELFGLVDSLRPFLKAIANRNQKVAPQKTRFYTKQEFIHAVEDAGELLTKDEKLVIRQTLSYSSKSVKDVMTPLDIVETVRPDDTLGPVLLTHLHKSGHSRFPVIDKASKEVVGILQTGDAVPAKARARVVRDVMEAAVCYLNQDLPMDHAVHGFLQTGAHLFIVVNEQQEPTGVISIEDILAQIIGRNIADQFDQYHDLRAVAELAAAAGKKSTPRKQPHKEPQLVEA